MGAQCSVLVLARAHGFFSDCSKNGLLLNIWLELSGENWAQCWTKKGLTAESCVGINSVSFWNVTAVGRFSNSLTTEVKWAWLGTSERYKVIPSINKSIQNIQSVLLKLVLWFLKSTAPVCRGNKRVYCDGSDIFCVSWEQSSYNNSRDSYSISPIILVAICTRRASFGFNSFVKLPNRTLNLYRSFYRGRVRA